MTPTVGKRLRLLFSTGSLTTVDAGPYSSLRGACLALAKRGHAATVVGTVAKGEAPKPEGWGDVAILPFQRLGPDSWHFAPRLGRWLRSIEPRFHVVNLQSVWLMTNVQVAHWAYQHGIPYMITAHGNFNSVALQHSIIKKMIAHRLLLRPILDCAACIQAANEAEYNAIRAYGIKSPVCIIPSGIEPAPADESAAPLALSALGGKKAILYLGRLHRIKNIEGLLHAWSLLHHDFADWRLVIAGGGPASYSRELQDLAHG